MQFVSRTLGSIWQCAPMLQPLMDVFSAMLLCSPTTHESSIWVDFMSLVGWTGTNWQPPVTDSHRSLIWEIGYTASLECSLHEVSWIYISFNNYSHFSPIHLHWKFLDHFEMFLTCINYRVLNDTIMWAMNWGCERSGHHLSQNTMRNLQREAEKYHEILHRNHFPGWELNSESPEEEAGVPNTQLQCPYVYLLCSCNNSLLIWTYLPVISQ